MGMDWSKVNDENQQSLESMLAHRDSSTRLLYQLAQEASRSKDQNRQFGLDQKMREGQLALNAENIANSKADRAARVRDLDISTAGRVAPTIAMGSRLTPDTAAMLRRGGQDSGIAHTDAQAPSLNAAGPLQMGANGPETAPTATSAAVPPTPESDTWTGTPAQRTTAAQNDALDKLLTTTDDPKLKALGPLLSTLGPEHRAQALSKFLESGTEPIMSVDPRTHKVEKIGDAPKGTHFVNQPAPPNVINFGSNETPQQQVAKGAQAILEGRLSPSQAASLYGGFGKEGQQYKRAVMSEVTRVNPQFNFAGAESNYAFGKNTGTQTTVRLIDNIEKSLPVLERASDDFERSGVRMINKGVLGTADQFGSTKVATFNTARLGLADEIAKILSGGGTGSATSDAKLAQANNLLAADMTPQQLRATTASVRELLGNRRSALTSGTYMENKDAPAPAQPTGNPVVDKLNARRAAGAK